VSAGKESKGRPIEAICAQNRASRVWRRKKSHLSNREESFNNEVHTSHSIWRLKRRRVRPRQSTEPALKILNRNSAQKDRVSRFHRPTNTVVNCKILVRSPNLECEERTKPLFDSVGRKLTVTCFRIERQKNIRGKGKDGKEVLNFRPEEIDKRKKDIKT